MPRIALYGVVALVVAGIGLAVAWPGGEDPRPDRDLDAGEASVADGADPGALGLSAGATLSATSNGRVRRAGVPGSVRVAVRRGDDGSFVPDVSVVLTGTPPGGAAFSLQAWTDLDGRAVFERVPEGTGYRLVTQIGAIAPVERKDIEVLGGLETDVGVVVLSSAGIVVGMVVREDGRPIEDAVVTATTHPDTLFDLDQDPWPLAAEPPFFACKTVSDLAGHFRLPGVPPGLVAVRVTAKGFRGRTERTWVPPQATSPAWVDVVLRPTAGLRVRVVDLKTLPMPGVSVSVGTWADPRFEPRVEGRTDDRGEFELTGFLGLPPVAVWLPAGEGGGRLLFRGVEGVEEARCVAITAARVTVRVLALEDDRPVPGAQVMLDVGLPPELRNSPTTLLGTAVGETDARGEVTLPVHRGALLAGQVRSAHRRTVPLGPNVPPAQVGEVRIDGNLRDPFLPGEARLVTVRVAGGLPLDVTVVDSARAPIAGATVTLLDAFGGDAVSARTGADGAATFERVVADHRYTLTAAAPGFATTRREVSGLPRESSKRYTVHLTLAPGLSVRGVVNDGTGRPLAGARVQADVGGPIARTGADGRYLLEGVPVLVEGRARRPTLRLRAWAEGFAARTSAEFPVSVEIVPQSAPPIVLGVGNEVRGVVLDHERVRVRYPVIEVVGADGRTVRTGTASAVGEFTLRDVPPGTWRLVGVAPGVVARLPQPLQIEDDVDPPFVTLAAEPRVWVEFQVVDKRDRAVAGARLEPVLDGREGEAARLAGLGSAGGLPTYTDSEGRLRVAIQSLPRTVRVSLEGFPPQELHLPLDRRPDPLRVPWRVDGGRSKPR